MTQLGSLAPLAKSYTTIEKAGWRRRYYRRAYRGGYYGYGYPYYGYGYTYPSSSTLSLLWVWLWSWLRLALLGRPFYWRCSWPLVASAIEGRRRRRLRSAPLFMLGKWWPCHNSERRLMVIV